MRGHGKLGKKLRRKERERWEAWQKIEKKRERERWEAWQKIEKKRERQVGSLAKN